MFKRETIERMAGHFENILESIVENRKIKLSEIEMITTDEKNQILFEFNSKKMSVIRKKQYMNYLKNR